MKLKKFRIHHYKSIIDSGDCPLSSDFTILIGKNESGKTSLLEALRDFDREQPSIADDAFPLSGIHPNPTLELTFAIDAGELDAMADESQMKIPADRRANILDQGIGLTKSFSGEYRLKGEALAPVSHHGEQEESNPADQIKKKRQRMEELLKGCAIPDLNLTQDIEILQNSIRDLKGLVKSHLGFIHEEKAKVEIVELLHDMTRILSAARDGNPKISPQERFTAAMVKRLPRFVFFSDFNDILPFSIPMDAARDHQTVGDFARMANLDLDQLVKTEDLQKRINILNRAAAAISGEFLGHWGQNKITLIARPEGNNLLFGVKEAEGTDVYKVEQRSRGFQWFLSFYLRLNRYKSDDAVILIDEPGMNLHPVAQKDILKVLTEKGPAPRQVIFSTHSPALIDADHLDRIRCVIKDQEKGTLIKNSVHNGIDGETLLPVMTALGARLPVTLPPPVLPPPVSPDPQQSTGGAAEGGSDDSGLTEGQTDAAPARESRRWGLLEFLRRDK